MKKRTVTDHTREGLETIRNIKADDLEESYLAELNEKAQTAEQDAPGELMENGKRLKQLVV